MSIWELIVVVDLALAGLVILGRGLLGSHRTYTLVDGVLGAAECAFLIWVVVTKL